MTKKRDRKYRGIVIGLIFGLLMTGVMSFTVLADEAESPPDAVLAGEITEDALSGEDALASPEAPAESLSEEMNADSDDSKSEPAKTEGGGSADTAETNSGTEALAAAETKTETGTPAEAAGVKTEADAAEVNSPADAAGAKSESASADAAVTASPGEAAQAAASVNEEPAESRALLAGAPGNPVTPTSPTLNGEMADLTDASASLTGDESLKGTATAAQADVENAIQKAVDAALASASSTTTTLRVDVESGDYTGGLKVAKPAGSTLSPSLILYVFAPGSYGGAATGAVTTGKISAAADGSARLGGDVLIDGINVVLAGLYYSLDTKISVRNAKADIYGTTGSDTINTVLDGSGTLVVHSGDGADEISVSGSTTAGGVVATVYGEAGDDRFNVDLLTGTKNASGTAPKQAEIRISDTDAGTLNLTGTLQEGNSSALSGTITMTSSSKRARVTAVNSEGYKTYINANGTTNYMDSLVNKKEVVLNAGDTVRAASFTDYVLTGTNADGIAVDGTNAYFSNIKAVSDGTLTVGSIDAPLVNVLLEGSDIILNGTVSAKNLTVHASGKAAQGQEDLTVGLAGVDTITVKGIVDAQTARIQVLKDADLRADNISLTAETAAKVDRDALIGSYGERILSFADLTSGILIDGKLEAVAGSITALASAVVTMVTGNAKASFDGLVALPEAVVTIGGGADLIASGDVLTRAVSRVIGAVKASFAEAPYASDAVTAIGGKAAATMAGRILAGGSVIIAADGSMQADTDVSGSDTGLAVTTADEDVRAEVTGSGTIEALGTVDIVSTLSGDLHTAASAGGQDQGYETTLTNTQATLKNILKAVSGFAGEGKSALLEKLFAAMTEAQTGQYAGIDAMFDQAAVSMKDGAVQASSAQNAFGATAVSYAGGRNFAGVDTTGHIYAGSGLSVRADADFAAVVRADSFASAADEINPSAAAVANTIFENTAELRSGAVYAKDLTVSAVSGKEARPVTSVVKAYAGDGVYDGIAGAAALQKALASTKALIGKGAAVSLLNRTSLAVKAVQHDRFVTVADAAAAGNGTTDGTGAGLAFAVTGVDVRSAVEDGVAIRTFSPKTGAQALGRDEISDYIAGLTLLAPMVDKVAVTADRQGDEIIYASAGTDGGDGNAIRAEAALFSGSSVQAYLGDPGTDEVLDATGDVDVTANNTGSRQAAADADAAPAAGSGMVLTMTYTNDKSTADLQRALKSKALTVRAVSNVKTRSRAKAGAKGTATVKETGSDGEDGEADQRISGILDGAASIASAAGGAIPWGLGRTRAKAKTAEGSMGAAAAYAQNVEKNYANAAVSGRYTIVASGDLVVEAIGENGADISADASSVKNGTGTAAAVNVVAYDFAALLDSGKATATSVTVHAGIPDADAATYRVTAVSGAGDGKTGLVGSIAVNEVYGTSRAEIEAGTAQVSAAKDMVIKAEDLHTEETVATAGVSEDGKPVRTSEEETPGNIGVGASFALSDVRTDTKATVGEGRVVEGLRVYILADNKDVRGTYSMAGKDPSAYGQDFAAAAADGSAAVSIGENRSIALADEGAQIIADGTSDGSGIERTGEPKAGDIYIKGVFGSSVRTLAGMFRADGRTYSGGTAAVNLAASDAKAEMRGYATANGNVLILADSDDADETEAVSGRMPADLRRYLARMGLAENIGNAQAVLRGEISGRGTNGQNEIAALINEVLNRYKDKDGSNASNSNPLTYNVLAAQNAKSEGTDEENIRKAQEESNKLAASGTNVSVGEGIIRNDLPGADVRAAAALGLNLTAHNAYALVSGTVDKTNHSVDIRAEVTSSAKAKGSAENVKAEGDGYELGLGAALSVNRNTASAEIAKGTYPSRVESQGAVSLTAEQLRNVSENDRETFEAEAVPGYYSEENGQIFGTLVIVRSGSVTEALVADETTINANLGRKNGVVTVSADETGRVAAKAFGTTYGPAFIIVDAKDIIRAEIGEKAQVTGYYIIVRARKQAAGRLPKIYTFANGKEYVTVSAKGADEETVYTVMADTAEFYDSYSSLKGYSESLRQYADYFLETLSNAEFAGTFRNLEAQGASTILREALIVSISIGKESVLTAEGNINITAETSSQAAVLLGTKDFGFRDLKEVGTSVVLVTSDNVTKAVVGDDAKLTAGKYYVQLAMESAVKSAAVLPGSPDEEGVTSPGGGSIIVLTDTDEVLTEIGTGTVIEGALAVSIGAELGNDKNSLVSQDNRKAGAKSTGGNNTYMYSASSVLTKAGINAKIRSSQGDVELKAFTGEQMISLPGANSDALPGAVAALMNIMRSEGSTVVETGRVEITAKKDVRLKATAESYLITVDPITEKASLYSPKGAVVFFDAARCVETLLGEGSSVTAGGNVYLISSLDEKMLIVLLPVQGTDGAGLSGLAAGAKSRNIVRTVAGAKSGQDWRAADAADAASVTNVTADGSIAVTAVLDSLNQMVTAGVNGDERATAGGAAAAIIEKNIVDAAVSNMAYLKAMASQAAITVEKAGTDSEGKKKTHSRTGIILYAGAKEDILMTVKGAGASGGVSVNGTIADVNVANTVRTRVGKDAQLFAGTEIRDEFTGEVGNTGTSGDIHIEAEDQTDAVILAGGLRKADTASESPTVFYGFFGKTVSAKNEGLLAAAKDAVEVVADETTTVTSFMTASGPAPGAAGVSGVVYMKSTANAFASGYLRGEKSVFVSSNSDNRINNISTVVDGTENNGNAGTGLLVYLYNGASSEIADESTVLGGDVTVAADSKEDVSAYVQGSTGNDYRAVIGGSLMIVLTGTVTTARIGADASVGGVSSEKAGEVIVRAKDIYTLTGVVGTVDNTYATRGGVSAAASVSYNTVAASVGRGTQMKVRSLTVAADSVRTANILTAMTGDDVGAVETAGTAAVIAIGSLLNKDAHNAIYAGGQSILPGAMAGHILQNGGTAVSFNDFTDGSLPTIDIDGMLAAGLAGVGETIDMANGAGQYDSILQPEGEALPELPVGVYKVFDGVIGREVTRYNNKEDYVSAWIEPDVVVTADSDVTVSARILLNLYVIAGAVGRSAEEGIGSGTAAVFMNGNVYADVYGTLTSGGKIEITASAEAGISAREDLSFRETSVLRSLTHTAAQKGISAKQEPNRTGIYALSIAGAQAAPGGRDNVAYTSVSSDVTARLHGTVNADSLKIRSVFGFDNVHATSIAAAKGNKDLTRILALEYYDGFVEAGITKTAAVNLSGKSLDVKTQSIAAMAPRAGIPGSGMRDMTAVTAAAAVNRTESYAYIAGGVNVNAEAADVTISAETKSEADAEILAYTADASVLDLGLVIVVNDPVNMALINRCREKSLPQAETENGIGTVNAKTLCVNALTKAKTDVRGTLLSKGKNGYLNGLVLMALVNSENSAAVWGTNVRAESVTVKALTDNRTTVTGETGDKGIYGVGGTMALGYIGSYNTAEVSVKDAVIEANDFTVYAGADKERVKSDVIVTVNPGGLAETQAKAMNVAIARNDLFNLAWINGGDSSNQMGVITAQNDIKVYSAQDSLAKAEIRPHDRTIGAIGAGAAFAVQDGNASAYVSYTKLNAKNIYVQSWYNTEAGFDSAGFLCEDKGAIAIVTPAQDPGHILAKHLTNAEALFIGAAVADLYGCDVEASERTDVKVYAQSYAKALMDAPKINYNYGWIGVSLIHAEALGLFTAEVVEPLENGTISSMYVNVIVNYIAVSDAATAMVGGQKVSREGNTIKYNTATAKTGTMAEASLKRIADKDASVFIFANGAVAAHAYVAETVFSYWEYLNAFDTMATSTTAEIAVEQRAHMDPETLASAARLSRIEIRSLLYGYAYLREDSDEEMISGACAEVGYPVFEENSMRAALLLPVTNKAESVVKVTNLAYIHGPGEIYFLKDAIILAETSVDSLGCVRLSPEGVETAQKMGTSVSALTRNRTEASVGSNILLVLVGQNGLNIAVLSTDSSKAKAESLYSSGRLDDTYPDELVRAGIGTLDEQVAIYSMDGDASNMSVTRSWVGEHSYLDAQSISFVTVNNNWAEAGMKSVDGYLAWGGDINKVPTVMAVDCDVTVGTDTALIARSGNVNLHTHSYLESTAKAITESANFRNEESVEAENVIRQSERILIGMRAFIQARFDVSIVVRGAVKMEADALNGEKPSKEGASTAAGNRLLRREAIELARMARLRTWYGDITLNIIASGDSVNGVDTSDHLAANASERRAGQDPLSGLNARNTITLMAFINTMDNSELYAPFGTVNVKVQDGYGDNTSINNMRKTDIRANAEGTAGRKTPPTSISAVNDYMEDLQVTVQHSTITGNNVNITASREAMNILARCIADVTRLLTTGYTVSATNHLQFNTDVKISHGSYVRGYSNVSITAKTESEDLEKRDQGVSKIRAEASVKHGAPGNTSNAVNTGIIRENISIEDGSYIYGRIISMNAIGWHKGDEVNNGGIAGSAESLFFDPRSEFNNIYIDDAAILFVGSMAGAVVDVYYDGYNAPEVRQIGLENTPEFAVSWNVLTALRGSLIPDKVPGCLIVSRVRRVYETDQVINRIQEECRNILERAVSGGAMTDITVLNRSGLPLAWMMELDLNVDVTPGSYDYYCLDRTRTYGYAYGSGLNQAAESYPAGGLISEVFYPNVIMGPTVTFVGSPSPSGFITNFTHGVRYFIDVYRNSGGTLTTTVLEVASNVEFSNTSDMTDLSEAASDYSFRGTTPNWTADALRERYNGESSNRSADSMSGSRNTGSASDSQSTAGNDGRAGAAADGSTAKDAGSNGQSETAGNQAAGTAGNASGGSQGGLNDDIKGSGADIDSDDESDSTSALAMGGKMLPVAAAATAGALFIIFLLLKRRKEDEEQ